MKKYKIHCDYCGKKITSENSIKSIRTFWQKVLIQFPLAYTTVISGDGCLDCYRSYLSWKRSRKNRLAKMKRS